MIPDAHVGIGAYVLHALPADERRGFEEHLAGCSICQAELPGLTAAAARLGSAVAEQPPPSLKPRVMAEVGVTRQIPPIARHSRPGPVTEYPTEPQGPQGPQAQQPQPPQAQPPHYPPTQLPPTQFPPTQLPPTQGQPPESRDGQRPDAPEAYYDEQPPEQTYTRRNLLGLAAGVLAVAGAGAVAYDQFSDARALRRERDRVAAVLNESDARTNRKAVEGGGRVTVVRSRRRDEAVVVVAGLPEAQAGREYQLWFVEGPAARSLGLLGRRPEPTNTLVIAGGISRAVAFAISVEPTGGSAQPTTTPFGVVNLPS